jgi:hypothetical protein
MLWASTAKKIYLGDDDLPNAVRRASVVRAIRLRLTNKRIWSKVVSTRPLPFADTDGDGNWSLKMTEWVG